MTKSAGKTSSSAPRPIAPPSVSQHLREFVSRPHAWAVLARNLIPVVGIYFFGWSAGLTVFNYWFDGLTALAAIIAALVPRALRETEGKPPMIPLHDLLLSPELRRQIENTPALWFTFGSLAAGHFWKALQSGYDVLPDNQLKQRVRWDVYILLLRAVAMFLMAAHGLNFILVPLMALLLSYFEIWPERVLGAVFGDPSKLYEYDPDHKK